MKKPPKRKLRQILEPSVSTTIPQPGVYLCYACGNIFESYGDKLMCDDCHDTSAMVLIYLEHDAVEQAMYMPTDWQGG